jgi:hypothetical protein
MNSRFVFDEPLVVTRSKVRVFNQRHPVGSSVAIIKDDGEVVETTIVRRADILSGLVPVVWLDGITGAYSFDRVVA